MTSDHVWRLLCYIHILRRYNSDVLEAAKSDPDAVLTRLLHDFRDWSEEYCRTVSDALQRYQDEGQGDGMEAEIAELRKFLDHRLS